MHRALQFNFIRLQSHFFSETPVQKGPMMKYLPSLNSLSEAARQPKNWFSLSAGYAIGLAAWVWGDLPFPAKILEVVVGMHTTVYLLGAAMALGVFWRVARPPQQQRILELVIPLVRYLGLRTLSGAGIFSGLALSAATCWLVTLSPSAAGTALVAPMFASLLFYVRAGLARVDAKLSNDLALMRS